MDFMLPFELKKLSRSINYHDKIMLIGSCFTEHIGNSLGELKFSVLQNPNGILFDPVSVCKSLVSYVQNKQYSDSDLFQLNEVWHSWQHHSRFSNTDKKQCLRNINESQSNAHHFLKAADKLIITLGTSFSYRLTGLGQNSNGSPLEGLGAAVANCHRAPAQWFNKQLLEIEEIIAALDDCIKKLIQFNSKLQFIFTVSPVRHIRDGVVENNRSKARLIESVHHLVNKYERAYYFPAYEIVIDVLRDYRYYDVDLVHPNYMATEFVLERFSENCIDEEAQQMAVEIKSLVIARKHKPFHPETNAHKSFLMSNYEKAKTLQELFPFIDFADELNYFTQASKNR